MRLRIVGILALGLVACENVQEEPDYLIESDKFVEVLTDFETAEALIRLGLNRTKDSLILNDSIYQSVFRKHNITQAVFDSNYTYYSDRPEEFEKMHETIISVISSKSEELKK